MAAVVATAVAAIGCGIGESGIGPPTDRIFFPASLAVDPSGKWVYVVNSNSDLRYNAGTVIAADLELAAQDRARPEVWGRCPRNNFLPPPTETAPPFCCRDFLDDRVLNCDERGYIDPAATVRIGSFGGAMTMQTYEHSGAMVRRLYVAVRAEPSITFIDATVAGGRLHMGCGARQAGDLCDEASKIRGGTGAPDTLPEEPSTLMLDAKLGILYVGHLSTFATAQVSVGGISVIDVCAPQAPRLASVAQTIFPGSLVHPVTAIAIPKPGDASASVFAASRFTADVTELRLAGAQAPCDGGTRPLELVPASSFVASPFSGRDADLRGLLFSPEGSRAYVLHRQLEIPQRNEYNPPTLIVVDRRVDELGRPNNVTTDVIEVCRGPTRLRLHDAGRGPRLYVSCFEGGQIYVIDPGQLAVRAIIDAGPGPADLVFSGADPALAFIAGFADNTVSVVDLRPGSPTENRVVQRIGFPRPAGSQAN